MDQDAADLDDEKEEDDDAHPPTLLHSARQAVGVKRPERFMLATKVSQM